VTILTLNNLAFSGFTVPEFPRPCCKPSSQLTVPVLLNHPLDPVTAS